MGYTVCIYKNSTTHKGKLCIGVLLLILGERGGGRAQHEVE